MASGRRMLYLLIAVCLLTGLFLPASVFAADNAIVDASAADTTAAVQKLADSNAPATADIVGLVLGIIPFSPPICDINEILFSLPAKLIDERRWYSPKIPMKKEYQKLLWDYSNERGLDYFDMLALISLESNYNEKCSTKNNKGLFQLSTGNCNNLAKTLKTPNKPLDGAININWGTAFYSWILADERVRDLPEEKKRDAALSIYHKGSGGYDKRGIDKSYLKVFYKKRDQILTWF